VTVVLALAAAVVPASDSAVPEDPLRLEPCHVDGLAEQVRCGIHEVDEDRAAGSGRRIPVHVAVLPPLRRAAAADPLFILAGGPGQGARGYARLAARYFQDVRRTRPIVLVDLRGTGASNPLACPWPQDELAALGALAPAGAARECLAGLDADVRHYTHEPALADLDEIRRRLGYEGIHLWGGSWGTRTALLYALTYPEAVRSVVLDGAVPLDAAFPAHVAPSAQRALRLLHERCAADPACAAAFPDPARELGMLLARLDIAPVTAVLKHPRTGADVEVMLRRDAVAEIVRVALYTPQDAVRLLPVIRRALDGDFGPLAAQAVHSASFSEDMALGATMAILCSEDLPASAPGDIERLARGTFLGSAYAQAWRERCSGWPAGPPIRIDRGAISNAPALILSGLYDPVTPPSSGEAMARHFPDHQHVIVPGAAHNASFAGCAPELIARFLQRGATVPLDTGCLAGAPLPPLVLDHSGGRS
jgi:pimeloyl-ACP methyl ester carboxylesterase